MRIMARIIAVLLAAACLASCAPNFSMPADGILTLQIYAGGRVAREAK
jgi:hypothetical protein